jgi:hypothetical protein
MSRHPISPHYGVSLASGRTTNVRGALGGTVPRLDVRLLNPASPQSFRDIWPSGPVPAEMPRTVKGHAKTYDLEPVYQWRSALSLHIDAKSKQTIFNCG